ncbi:MAG: 30S ribosomal protein S19e [Candidatus Hadarchaeales archaeon]
MTSPVLQVRAQALLEKLKERLKQYPELTPPPWSHFVKTGVHRERRPEQPDWWYMRAASILRRLYLDGPVGVSRLRTYYGGRKNRGQAPEHFRKGSGKIIRTILQQLEKAGLVETKVGRRPSKKGVELLHALAKEVMAEK